jgi:hypothetical protein
MSRRRVHAWFIVASAVVQNACARDPDPRALEPTGCYRITWADTTGKPDASWFPSGVQLAGGPTSGAIVPVPLADTAAFWALHAERSWIRTSPDSVMLWFGNGFGGTRVFVALEPDSLHGWVYAFGDTGPPFRPQGHVAAARIPCASRAPAT